MPKFQDPRTPVRHPETDSAPLTAAERARAIIEQQLAKKQQNSGPPGASGGKAGGVHKPGKGAGRPLRSAPADAAGAAKTERRGGAGRLAEPF